MLKALLSQNNAPKNETQDVEQDQDDELWESLRRYNALVEYHMDEDTVLTNDHYDFCRYFSF